MRLEINYGLPSWLSGNESACSEGDAGESGSIPVLRRFLEGGHGNSPQYTAGKIFIDGGAWQAMVHRIVKSQTRLK